MPEFFLELFSEEIPAGMQYDAANELARICGAVLADLSIENIKTYSGPRRIALAANVSSEKPGSVVEARGPRDTAPEAALLGFLGKYKARPEEVVSEGGYFLLRRDEPAVSAVYLITSTLPSALARLSWPKSMRWGQGGDFAWVRPLRRLICLLDGEVLPIKLGPVTAGNSTEGHRIHAPGIFSVSSCSDWKIKLQEHFVMVEEFERKARISKYLAAQLEVKELRWVEDYELFDEVGGLVEWPVPLIGKIDEKFMDLPSEVRELSMKINQRYFALRDLNGKPAPHFAFVANLEAPDDGAAIIAGNERVLRARLSDARHFWEMDLKTPLDQLLPKLENITLHAKLGNQLQRSGRLADLANLIAIELGADDEETRQVEWAGRLCKADLVTGMVGEFPELQGVMGGYYAEKRPTDWDGKIVGPAIKAHYQPRGPNDAVPRGLPACAVALADKIDILCGFFCIDEEPTGSRDPFGLRRAGIGVARIIVENRLEISLIPIFHRAYSNYLSDGIDVTNIMGAIKAFHFVAERLRVQLKNEGKRHDLLAAIFSASEEDDFTYLVDRADELQGFLKTSAGKDLLAAYRRMDNILKPEFDKGEDIFGSVDPTYFREPEETTLFRKLNDILANLPVWFGETRQVGLAMKEFALLRDPVDAFFNRVLVNDPEPLIRRNRLRLLAKLRKTMYEIADFSKIEG